MVAGASGLTWETQTCSEGELGVFGGGSCLGCIPVEVWDMEPARSVFRASTAEAASWSCGLRVTGASRGGNPLGYVISGGSGRSFKVQMGPD